MMVKVVAYLLVLSLCTSELTPALAQIPIHPQPARSTGNLQQCISRGRVDGLAVKTNGAFAAGLAGGLCLGLIGTAIAYGAQETPDPPARFMIEQDQDPACLTLYLDAFGKAGRKKKQTAALGGGLFGTAVIVILLVQAQHR